MPEPSDLFPDNLDRLTTLERAQQLHDATLRRHEVWHQEHLERLERLEDVIFQQQAMLREVLTLQERFGLRQDDQALRQDALAAHQRDHAQQMAELRAILHAVLDLLRQRDNGSPP
jgi:hypothetical protein